MHNCNLDNSVNLTNLWVTYISLKHNLIYFYASDIVSIGGDKLLQLYKLRTDDTRSVRLKTLSAGPQRKSIYEDETHRTGGTAKEPPASTARMFVRSFAIIYCIIGVANGTQLKEGKCTVCNQYFFYLIRNAAFLVLLAENP